MHDHNNGKGNNSMLWMMLPCILLIVVVLFGGGKLVASNYLWLVILGVCVVPHLWMMFKGGHGGHNDNTENKMDDIQTKNENDKSKHSGGCH
ncbi:MAG: hypothetical protein NT161_00365 [Candidatus Nomurabacteria bacterium]|nr:hypothetical protein [Candidatus Nomurabacteria bacterium]